MKKLTFLLLILAVLLPVLESCGDRTSGEPEPIPPKPPRPDVTQPSEDLSKPSSEKDFVYTVNRDGSISIIRYIGKDSTVVIPSGIDGRTVREISGYHDRGAFENCNRLKTVIFPETLTQIGARAFAGCRSLRKIKLSARYFNKKSQAAFMESGLEEVELEEGITEIPDMAFAKTNLRTVVLPSSVKTVRGNAFASCKHLQQVILNQGVEVLEPGAFVQTAIVELFIPKTVKVMSRYAFYRCHNLNAIKFDGNAPQADARDEKLSERYQNFTPIVTFYHHSGASGFDEPGWILFPKDIW